jgi:hypothetical protein
MSSLSVIEAKLEAESKAFQLLQKGSTSALANRDKSRLNFDIL